MKRKFLLLGLLLSSLCANAQVAHPRIWLDSPTLARLNALVSANDPAWVALKARADVLAAAPVSPYAYDTGTDPICYGCVGQYRGSGWGEALTVLSMAYKMTGNTLYSNQVKAVMRAMIAAGATPILNDNGYEARNFVGQLGTAYDWVYDQLSATSDTIGVGSGNDISNLIALVNTYWATVNSKVDYSFGWYGTNCAAEGNFYTGYLLGFGLTSIALEGDDSNTAAISANLASRISTCLAPAFNGVGLYSGAYNMEGTAYANQYHYLDYFWALQTAGKANTMLSSLDYVTWMKRLVRQIMHFTTPKAGFWQYLDEGDVQGSNTYTNNMYKSMLNRLPVLLNGTTEGGWAQYMTNRYTGGTDDLTMDFLTKTSIPEVDFTLTEPLAYLSPGDYHSFMRTDWTPIAAQSIFVGTTVNDPGHQMYNWGSLTMRNGSDYLLVNPNSCTTSNCYGPGGGSDYGNTASWMLNGLFMDDSTAYASKGYQYCMGNYGGVSTNTYAGCQRMTTKTPVPPLAHAETVAYAYYKMDLTSSYGNNPYSLATPLSKYQRSWVSSGDVSFVYDNVVALTPAGGHRSLYWHLPTSATTSPAGPSVSSTWGASKLWIKTLLPSTNFKGHFEQDYYGFSGTTLNTTGATAPGSTVLNIANTTLQFPAAATTATGSKGLTFAMGYSGVVAGMAVTDSTNSVIPAGTIASSVVSYSPGSVNLSKAVTGTVAVGDTISFNPVVPGMVVEGVGVPTGTTIVSATQTTATLSAAATGDGIPSGQPLSFLPAGGGGKTLYSQRLVVDDANAPTTASTPFLTVLATTSADAAQPTTTLISTTNYYGALYDDGVSPRLVLFSTDGTQQTGATYATTYTGVGRHVVVDLAQGMYFVKQGGTVLATGLSVASDGSLAFTATNGGTFAIAQGGAQPPVITTASLPDAVVNQAYSQTLSASGDTPITWSIAAGSLPAGLSLDAATGTIAGTLTVLGTSPITVRASNANGTNDRSLSIKVSSRSTTLVGVTVGGKASVR